MHWDDIFRAPKFSTRRSCSILSKNSILLTDELSPFTFLSARRWTGSGFVLALLFRRIPRKKMRSLQHARAPCFLFIPAEISLHLLHERPQVDHPPCITILRKEFEWFQLRSRTPMFLPLSGRGRAWMTAPSMNDRDSSMIVLAL